MLIFKTYINPIDGVTSLYDGTEINTVTLNNGGSGYAVNDIFTINSGNELAIGKVLSISSGVVLTFSVLFAGFGYSVANGLTTNTISGSGSGLVINVTGLQTRNTIFAHSVLGNDSNPGTRTLPIQTVTRGTALLGNNDFSTGTILAVGLFTENPTLSGYISLIFEGESYLNGNIVVSKGVMYNLRAKNLISNNDPQNNGIRIDYSLTGNITHLQNSFINTFSGTLSTSNTPVINNNTFLIFENYISSTSNVPLTSSICINIIDLYRFSGQTVNYPIFRYFLFRKNTLWQWNGVTIPIIYTDSSNYILDVWNSLLTYANAMSTGTDKSYLLLMLGSSFASCPILYTDSILGQTNKVVDDNPNTGIQIFNKYTSDGNNILDYSLSLTSNNVALTMGDPLLSYQYVGCYRTNIGGQNTSNPMVYDNIINVNTDGTDDTVTTPNLLLIDSSGNFLMNQDSLQFWNRIRTNVLSYDRGKSSFGTGSQLNTGLSSGYYFGKSRKYDATHCVVETVEVLPYDNSTTPSTSPKFSMAFNGQTLVYYFLSGVKIGQSVLFSDLAGLGITVDSTFLSIYSAWAVSTADLESYYLSQLTNLVGSKQYPLTYFRGELNAHYKS